MPGDGNTEKMSRRQALKKLAGGFAAGVVLTEGANLLASAAENVQAAKELLKTADVLYPATVEGEAVLRKEPVVPPRGVEPNEITRYKESGQHRFFAVPVPDSFEGRDHHKWYVVQEIGGEGRSGFTLGLELRVNYHQPLTFKKPENP